MSHSPAPNEIGPMLFFRGLAEDRVRLSALVVRREGATPGALRTADSNVLPKPLARHLGVEVLRYDFELPTDARTFYEFEGVRHPVNANFDGDLQIGFVSCDGMELGDLDRESVERNGMWARLALRNEAQPLNLLLHGGDQIYADEVTSAHSASCNWPGKVPKRLDRETEKSLRETLRDGFFRRYLRNYSPPEFGAVTARVPSLTIWDDHDICDGWGSLRDSKLDGPVGRAIFAAAREAYLLFQWGLSEEEVPEVFSDQSGVCLGWHFDLPGLTLFAPDLRSERRQRQVMGPAGWSMVERALEKTDGERLLMVSSVPLLGPRLSLVERLMVLTPWMDEYEDDLRDQWQSRTHREEWRRMLRLLVRQIEGRGRAVTVVSGEIHLAARATMATAAGDMHQLVASGISHPAPPRGYARGLGALAWLGEAPLAGHPIRIRSLPGQRSFYVAERNFLLLERRGRDWTARWELEKSGATEPLLI